MSGEGPSPPGWHSSLMKHSHKSRLPPRPTLGPHQGPRRQPPPPLGAGWPQNGETPPGAYPQCSGLPRGRTLCKLGLSLPPWLGTHSPALAGEQMGMLPRGHMPSNCSQLPFIPDSPSVLLREGQMCIEVTKQPQGDEDCLLREGGG